MIQRFENPALRKTVSIACIVLCAMMAGAVIAGWFAGSVTLTQIDENFAPMQLNTALCFMIAAVALLAVQLKQRSIALLSALIVLVISGLTLSQYIFHVDFGIDNLIVQNDVDVRTSYPGRMSQNTAIAFMLLAMAVFSSFVNQRMTQVLVAFVIAAAGLSLVLYVVGEENIFGSMRFTAMAVHTALGFLLLATALLLSDQTYLASKVQKNWETAPYTAASLVLILTFLSWFSVYESIYLRNHQYFQTQVHDMRSALEARFTLYEQSLWGGVGLFNASNFVDRSEWQKYVDSLQIRETLPGVSGLGFIDFVQEGALPDYLEVTRADSVPYFSNHPRTWFKDKFIIKYIVPYENNRAAVGLDIGFEAHRREAAERARDMGKPALTRIIQLVQDNISRPGFLLLIPVYEQHEIPPSPAERRAQFEGWVYAPFIGESFLHDLVEIADDQIAFSVYDGKRLTPDNLIYASNPDYALADKRVADYTDQTVIELAGRPWTIIWASSPQFMPPVSPYVSYIIAAAGIIFAIFLYFILLQLVRQRALLNEKMEALAEATQSAEEANKAKSEFLANMSHELRTPLNSILGMIQLINPRDLEDNLRATFDTVSKSARSLLLIVNDILDLSKIEAGEVELEHIGFDAFASARYVVRSMLPMAENRGLRLECESTQPKILINGDPLRFERIITNLVNNAIRYTEEGGVIVRLRENPGSQPGHAILRCEVIDTGIGIPDDKRHIIFQKFTQADSSNTRRFGGTGLGLAITHGLVEMMGGTIGFESEEEKGTTFWFELPAERAQNITPHMHETRLGEVESEEVDLPSHIRDLRILIVEDHDMNQLFMKKLMSNLDIENYALVENGEEAVDTLAQSDFDVVLMDCHMPVMNGYDATKAIRAMKDEAKKNVPIIAMTANAMAEDRQKCLNIGMNDYLSKPVDVEKFKEALIRAVKDESGA